MDRGKKKNSEFAIKIYKLLCSWVILSPFRKPYRRTLGILKEIYPSGIMLVTKKRDRIAGRYIRLYLGGAQANVLSVPDSIDNGR